ncbi:MAG: cephalosporin hydroxylase, partial [Planctomycetes bacterium]|nr:cephalosporin hydroxylase [Planctomycetota bacterium]
MNKFAEERNERIVKNAANGELVRLARAFLKESILPGYSYNFSWMSRPIIQYPQEIVAMHEIIWETKPDLIIETGVAHGGSLIFNASMLALLDLCEGIEQGKAIQPAYSRRKVLGIDIEIREPNRRAIEAHPMASRIQLIQG